MNRHTGSCHCGAVRFEVSATIDHVRVCDCSICRQRGGLMFRLEPHQLKLLTPWEALSTYQWGGQTAKDYFCSVCGILPFRRPADLTNEERGSGLLPFDGWAINLRCLDDFDVSMLPVRAIHGSSL